LALGFGSKPKLAADTRGQYCAKTGRRGVPETGLVDIALGAERPLVEYVFGALIHDGTLVARERRFLGVVFEEVLADFRPKVLKEGNADAQGSGNCGEWIAFVA